MFFKIENPVLCDDDLPELVASMELQNARLIGVAHCIVPQQIMDPSVLMQPPITLQKMMKPQSIVAPNLLQPMEPPPSIVQILVPATLMQALPDMTNHTNDTELNQLNTSSTTTTTTTIIPVISEDSASANESTQGLLSYEEPINETEVDQNPDAAIKVSEILSEDSQTIEQVIEHLKTLPESPEVNKNMIPEMFAPVLPEILHEVLPQPQRAQQALSTDEVEDPPEQVVEEEDDEVQDEVLQDTLPTP